eukprot:PITA_32822
MTFTNASGAFGKNLAKIAREADEPAQWWEAFGSHCPELQKFAIRILSQTCSAIGCNQLLNKRLDSDPIVLEDIDPTSDWVVESHPTEFASDEDMDFELQMIVSLEHNVQLNADPDPLVPASASQPASPPVAGASSTQPRQKRISRLSQVASVAQPASATTSTVAVGDDDEEEPWGPLFDSDDDPEIDPHDLGSSGNSY